MKVAFATEDLKRVDAHFGWAKNIAVYDVTPDTICFVTTYKFAGDLQEDGTEDKLATKLDAIEDCARAVARKVHPIKVAEPEPIDGLLLRLQTVLRGTPPPWLRKALNKGHGRTLNLEDEVVHG